jgi:hypothetical protein
MEEWVKIRTTDAELNVDARHNATIGILRRRIRAICQKARNHMLPSFGFGGLLNVCLMFGVTSMLLTLFPFALLLIRWANADATKAAVRVPLALSIIVAQISFVGILAMVFYLYAPH